MLSPVHFGLFSDPEGVAFEVDDFAVSPPATTSPLDLRVYGTLAELRSTLQHLAAPQVVIVLDERFHGYAPSLLKRGHSGGKLTLVALGGLLAGISRRAIRSLAWDEIVLRREVCTAIAESLQQLSPGQRLVVLWPAWRNQSELAA